MGNDVILYQVGDGDDVVDNTGADWWAQDEVRLGAGISESQTTFTREGDDLLLTFDVAGGSLRVSNFFANSHTELVKFDAGTSYDRVNVLDQLSNITELYGTEYDDYLVGTSGRDILYGFGGADVLMGGAGNDTLVGGGSSYRDFYNGEEGVDTYRIALDGTETQIYTGTSTDGDRIEFGAGINPANIRGSRPQVFDWGSGGLVPGSDAVLEITDGTGVVLHTLRLIDYYLNESALGGIGQVTFADAPSVVWTGEDVYNRLPGEGNNMLYGTESGDVIDARGGNDSIWGNGGNDVLHGGDGDDLIDGGAGADQLFGGLGTDTLVGGVGDDYYEVDASDVVAENADEGNDTIVASGSYTLGANVEVLYLSGSGNDSGTGNALDNAIYGNAGNNILSGGAGADSLYGNDGNDTFVVDNVADYVSDSSGVDTILSSVSYNATSEIENLTLTGAADIDGSVSADGATILGNAGNNTLMATGQNATLQGGLGDDVYVVSYASDVVTEMAGEGVDTVQSSVNWSLGANVENLVLLGSSGLSGSGNGLNNRLTGNAANNLLDGGVGADTLEGGTGNDTYVVDDAGDVVTEAVSAGTDLVQSSVSYVLGANVENLVLTGSADLVGTGNSLANNLSGNSGNNLLDGGAGNDVLAGGAGNDTYLVDSSSDVVSEAASAGIDLVRSTVTFTLATNVENLELLGTANINGTGNTLANSLTGNAGNNLLDGGSGADTLVGGAGNDTYVVDNAADVLMEVAGEGSDLVQSAVSWTLGVDFENLTLTGTSNINGVGNDLANSLTGNSGNNSLTGGLGADTMTGGAGNDTYVVDDAGDVVTEAASAGTDLVQSSISYALGANVENLTLTGSSAINATGNTLANSLTGNAGNNLLDGGSGADTMAGGTGDDTYVVDNAADVVTEAASAGTDLVQSSITYTLGSNLENLTLTGTSAINGTGNTLANVLTGNSGANSLSGGSGADTMIGGAGNDTYVVDNTADVVTENASEGTDIVESSVTYTLSANVEKLTLTGTGNINGTGNDLANTLTGNTGNNSLNGGTGVDTLIGGAGNDTYVVDSASDVITELASEGTDVAQASVSYTIGANVENLVLTGTDNINGTGNTLANSLTGNAGNNSLNGGTGADSMSGGAGDDTDVAQASVSYTIGANVENLVLTGTDNINGTGNTLANSLTGNAGNNSLNGGTGADSMSGGAGDDTYVVDDVGDVVTETASSGTDLVQSSITYTLGSNVENLTLTGTTAINGTGNTLANVLTGNTGANSLSGGSGDDTLDGLAGADSLVGGAGNDTYKLGRGYGADQITENDATAGNTDIAQFASDVASDQIWFRQVSNNLEVSIIGTSDQFLINNWYGGSQYQIEQFKAGDGKTLTNAQVQNLVQAMAAFSPPAAGQTTMPAAYATALNPTLAANWQ